MFCYHFLCFYPYYSLIWFCRLISNNWMIFPVFFPYYSTLCSLIKCTSKILYIRALILFFHFKLALLFVFKGIQLHFWFLELALFASYRNFQSVWVVSLPEVGNALACNGFENNSILSCWYVKWDKIVVMGYNIEYINVDC